MKFGYRDLVGRYQLELTDELRAFVERVFVDLAPASERAAVRANALHEAEGSELEAYPDGTIVSRSRGQEFFRVKVDPNGAGLTEVAFQKSAGADVRLEMRDADTVVAHQAGKFTAVFRRAPRES